MIEKQIFLNKVFISDYKYKGILRDYPFFEPIRLKLFPFGVNILELHPFDRSKFVLGGLLFGIFSGKYKFTLVHKRAYPIR